MIWIPWRLFEHECKPQSAHRQGSLITRVHPQSKDSSWYKREHARWGKWCLLWVVMHWLHIIHANCHFFPFPVFLFSQFPEMDEWLCIVSDHPTMADDSERNLVKSEMWSSAAASSYSLCLAPVGFGGNHVKRAHKKKCFKNIRQKQNLLSSDFAFHRLQIWSTQDNIT